MTKRPEWVLPGEGSTFEWSSDTVRVVSAADWSERAVTMVEDTLRPGFRLARHHHRRMTEVFYCLAGSAVFGFDDTTVTATAGSVITVPPLVHHEVTSTDGARLLTVFAPGGFDLYLAEVADLVAQGVDDSQRMTELGQAYDIWPDA